MRQHRKTTRDANRQATSQPATVALNGRPVGSRQEFSNGFLRDLASVWQDVGRETMLKTAKDNPAVFFATCARLVPADVVVTMWQSLPRDLSPGDWAIMVEVVQAVKQALPNSANRPPCAVLEHVLERLK
jgi:hypothetical protein